MSEDFIEEVRKIVGLVEFSSWQKDKLDDLYREAKKDGYKEFVTEMEKLGHEDLGEHVLDKLA